jgi:hypothetical protein
MFTNLFFPFISYFLLLQTSGKTGDADAKEKAQQLLSQIDRLQENRRSEVVLFDDDVHRLKNVLSRAVTPSWLQGSFKDNPPK